MFAHATKGAPGHDRSGASHAPNPGQNVRTASRIQDGRRILGNGTLAAMGASLPASAAQRVASAFRLTGPAAAAAAVQRSHGEGRQLPADLAARAGAHLGISLDHVRLHDDAFARDAAAVVQANAFTVGDDVFFGTGMLETQSSAGRFRLLHQIVHTL